jgi:hypothetical protein
MSLRFSFASPTVSIGELFEAVGGAVETKLRQTLYNTGRQIGSIGTFAALARAQGSDDCG